MKTIFAAALFAVSVGGIGAASAMPLAPLSAADTAGVIQVAQGCGPGYARGPYGGCRPMFRGPPPRGPGYCPPASSAIPTAAASAAGDRCIILTTKTPPLAGFFVAHAPVTAVT